MAYRYNKLIQEIYQKVVNIIMCNFYTPLNVNLFRQQLFDNRIDSLDFYDFVKDELEVLKVDRKKGTISNCNKLTNTIKVWKTTICFN